MTYVYQKLCQHFRSKTLAREIIFGIIDQAVFQGQPQTVDVMADNSYSTFIDFLSRGIKYHANII